MNLKTFVFLLAIFCISIPLSAVEQELEKENEESKQAQEENMKAQLAMSSDDYPVTAGDVYSLYYSAGGSPVNYIIPVDASYKIRVSNLAVLDARGKTYLELKALVEKVVSSNYPLSGVQFVLTKPAVFEVTISGEVQSTTIKQVWAFSRLSEVLPGILTPYSSLRDVVIRSSLTGKEQSYDLFLAERWGEMDQNPRLRPGDAIKLKHLDRSVRISGAVKRPGEYQLLPRDTLGTLIEEYGGGFLEDADPSELILVRIPKAHEEDYTEHYLSFSKTTAGMALQNKDSLMVSSKESKSPVMFILGAIEEEEEEEEEEGTKLSASTKITVPFATGEKYSSLVQKHAHLFSNISALSKAYITRKDGSVIPVNVENLLYKHENTKDILVEPYDRLTIPFLQYFVNVAGAVKMPGRYPYIPDRTWEYYISLAGGFDMGSNAHKKIEILDLDGKTLSKDGFIPPEAIITASHNSFFYHFNRYAPVVTTLISILSASLSIYLLTSN